ncbi:MAG: DUF4906 domain-containing protein [Bacteroidales bacterium]|nr:DUF4906 domain-containing protein [Bacteroidales bacterium]
MKQFWTLFLILACLACSKEPGTLRNVTVRLDPGIPATRSGNPDEERINDLNLFAFREDGDLEAALWLDARTLGRSGSDCTLSLPRGLSYSLYACVNFGYAVRGIASRDELLAYRYYMAYPDEFTRGIPMTGIAEVDPQATDIAIALERMMAKISLRVDRRGLSEGVRLSVRSVILGASPRSALAFGPSHSLGNMDVFSRGFERSGTQADALNRDQAPGLSEPVSVYMLENLQGDAPLEPSYIEMALEYESPRQVTRPGSYLTYRFKLGEEAGNGDIQRNFHYRFTIRPEGDGLLTEDSWRVDRSALTAK